VRKSVLIWSLHVVFYSVPPKRVRHSMLLFEPKLHHKIATSWASKTGNCSNTQWTSLLDYQAVIYGTRNRFPWMIPPCIGAHVPICDNVNTVPSRMVNSISTRTEPRIKPITEPPDDFIDRTPILTQAPHFPRNKVAQINPDSKVEDHPSSLQHVSWAISPDPSLEGGT
jgi:hypothetical protein